MIEDSIGNKLMQQTRYKNMGLSPQKQGKNQPPLELPVPAGAKLIALSQPDEWRFSPADLQTIIAQRKTFRQYKNASLSQDELSFLLWATQGVKNIDKEFKLTTRTVPSAGARHAFETYLLINRVKGIPAGLYRYAASIHSIFLVNKTEPITAELTEACLKQAQITNCAVAFFWDAVVERMFWRYQERGYRYLHLDAGHVCQNLYLAAEAIGCGVCAIAAYDDDLVNKAIGLDGVNEFIIYIASLGKR
jgi:SagB-type dehydrogenase family enzyme